MKLGVLFSGGKDSCHALHLASQSEEVVCLISVISKNKESYMFHTPNVSMTELQAQAMDIPLISVTTPGEKEKELSDLKDAIVEAREKYGIEGVVTGAVESVYQASRVQKICADLGLYCFNPLWQKDQMELLHDLLELDYWVLISGVFAEPFDETWLGKRLDRELLAKLEEFQKKHYINPAGEGGEIETTVLDGPMFKHKIKLKEGYVEFDKNAGTFNVEHAFLVEK